jgi:hypothetical protein
MISSYFWTQFCDPPLYFALLSRHLKNKVRFDASRSEARKAGRITTANTECGSPLSDNEDYAAHGMTAARSSPRLPDQSREPDHRTCCRGTGNR